MIRIIRKLGLAAIPALALVAVAVPASASTNTPIVPAQACASPSGHFTDNSGNGRALVDHGHNNGVTTAAQGSGSCVQIVKRAGFDELRFTVSGLCVTWDATPGTATSESCSGATTTLWKPTANNVFENVAALNAGVPSGLKENSSNCSMDSNVIVAGGTLDCQLQWLLDVSA